MNTSNESSALCSNCHSSTPRCRVDRVQHNGGALSNRESPVHSSVVGIAALVVATGLHATSIRQQAPTSVDSLTQSSHIVFIGRVANVRATNVKALRAT